LEVAIRPGKSITQVYKLRNAGETDLAMTSKIVSFRPSGETGDINLELARLPARQGTWNLELSPWFSFQNADLSLGKKFILPAGREQEVVLKIRVPENAPEDDYYFTLLFETIPGVFLGQSGGQIEAKIGGNILLTVSQTGEPLKKAEIEQFSLANFQFSIFNFQFVDSFTNPQFLIRLKNTGRSFFKPQGSITTIGWFGQKYLLDLLPENVLVNSIRQIQCQKADRVEPCQLPAKFLLGRYKAKLEFGLDKVSDDYIAETIFWAIPAKLIIALLTTIFILFTIKNRLKLSS